jgi:hypothetical protein
MVRLREFWDRDFGEAELTAAELHTCALQACMHVHVPSQLPIGLTYHSSQVTILAAASPSYCYTNELSCAAARYSPRVEPRPHST